MAGTAAPQCYGMFMEEGSALRLRDAKGGGLFVLSFGVLLICGLKFEGVLWLQGPRVVVEGCSLVVGRGVERVGQPPGRRRSLLGPLVVFSWLLVPWLGAPPSPPAVCLRVQWGRIRGVRCPSLFKFI